MTRAFAAFLVSSLFVLVSSAPAHAIVIRADQPDAAYLALAASYPEVGVWVTGLGACSATVIEVDLTTGYAVTAASCAGGGASELRLGSDYFTPTSVHPVVEVSTHPGFDGSPDHNLAVIRFIGASFATPVASIYTGSDLYAQEATFVGYGRTGTGLTGGSTSSSLRRAATNDLDAVGASLMIDFDEPGNPGASYSGSVLPSTLEGIPCLGDAGGGVFVDFGMGPELVGNIAGVVDTSGGALCDYGDTVDSAILRENFDFLNDAVFGGGEVWIPTPEPGEATLLVSGLTGLLAMWRRRTGRAAAEG